jgi:hypothetical protein
MPRFLVTLYDRAKKSGKQLGFIEADNAHDATFEGLAALDASHAKLLSVRR